MARRRRAPLAIAALAAIATLPASGCRWIVAEEFPAEPVYASLAPPVLSLREKAARYEAQFRAHNRTPEGLADYARPRAGRKPDEPRYGQHADGPFHTGISLGAWSIRYAATRDRANLDDISKALEGLELLEAVTRRPGLFARYASLDPAPFDPVKIHRSNGRRAAPPLERYIWRGDVSKDQYAGVAFGLGACMAHVDDPALRARAAALARRIAAMLEETGERLVDVDGEETTHGNLSARVGPVRIALNAAIVLSIVKAAATPDVAGGERAAAYYRNLVDRHYVRAARNGFYNITVLTIRNHVNDNMSFLALYGILSQEKDPKLRAELLHGLERAWDPVSEEGTPFFDLVYAACGGERAVEAAASGRTHLFEFPDEKRELPIDLTKHPELGYERRFFNNRKGAPRADRPLPLYLRGASSMMWVRDPDLLVSNLGLRDEDWLEPMDYLETYWLGRLHGFIRPED